MASVTFQLQVKGQSVKPPTDTPRSYTLAKALQASDIFEKKSGQLITASEPKNTVRASLNNSFVSALYEAYNSHYFLVIRPDDVWLTIVLALADYINNHAEEMRDLFVTHQGKEDLIIYTTHVGKHIVEQFSEAIDKKTLASVRDFIEPRFSTTTANDSLVARVALLGALKNYFAYGCCIMCGIPQVTLEGTMEDWQKLRSKIVELGNRYAANQPQLGWWRDILLPIVDQFILSYQGSPNEDFWQSCANSKGGGSGPTYVSGWAVAFAPFEKGVWRLASAEHILATGEYGKLESTDFKTSATMEVPFTVNDNGNVYEAYMYAGGIVNTYDPTTNTLRPSFDFAMFSVPDGTLAAKDKVDWTQ